MKIGELIDISLISSSVAASTKDEFDYTGATTYNTGDEVKVSFESDGTTALTPVVEYIAVANTIKSYPPDNLSEWNETKVTNKWAMFDEYLTTKTTDTSQIEVEVNTGKANMVGLFGLTGSSVIFEVWRDGSIIETETLSLKAQPLPGWYSWLYDEYEYKTKLIWDYVSFTDTTLKVKIDVAGGVAECGSMRLGKSKKLGLTRYDAKVGIDDYSVYTTDALDRTYLSQGNYADRAEVVIWLDNSTIDMVRRVLTSVRGILSMWDLNNEKSDYDSLRILGYYRNFDITIPGPTKSLCAIEIGGST